MEAILLTLDAALMVWLLLSVRRCENRPGKPDLGFFSYKEDEKATTLSRPEETGGSPQGRGNRA
jgi:hypothetical protein